MTPSSASKLLTSSNKVNRSADSTRFASTKMPASSSANAACRSPEGEDAQMLSAEAEVALALDSLDYDEVISVASAALQAKRNDMDKKVIKSRKNLLWARSHAYRHKQLHELALKDARSALKLDPNDPSSYIRAALLFLCLENKGRAMDCLDRAAEAAEQLEPSTRAVWLRKIKKHRWSATHGHYIQSLPNEILIEIAQHLGPRSRASMSGTCVKWRQILTSSPNLWTTMIIAARQKLTSQQEATEWLKQIELVAERSNNTLKSVDLRGPIPHPWLERVFAILRRSARSLEHISTAVRDLEWCYKQLYRGCARLKTIVVAESSDNWPRGVPTSSSPIHVDNGTWHDLASTEPFILEELRLPRQGIKQEAIPLLTQHIQKCRILQNYEPRVSDEDLDEVSGMPTPEAREALIKVRLSLAETLEDFRPLYVESFLGMFQRPSPNPLESTFSKLKRLSHYAFGEHANCCFPNLEELYEARVPRREPGAFVRCLETSPSLRVLQIRSGDLSSVHFEPGVTAAIRGLRKLEELEFANPAVYDILLPNTASGDNGERTLDYPLPRLRRLAIDAYKVDLEGLALILMVRQRLQSGDHLSAAQHWASQKMESLRQKATYTIESPFQRGTHSNDPAPPPSSSAPRLENPEDYCALQKLKISNIVAMAEPVRKALELVVPEVEFVFDPL